MTKRNIKQKKNRRRAIRIEEKFKKTRHYFFLNPYEDCAFTKCPKCDQATKVRKFPLAIHIDPNQLFFLNKYRRHTQCSYLRFKDISVVSLGYTSAVFASYLPHIA